jgi:type IV secretion system protein VirB10
MDSARTAQNAPPPAQQAAVPAPAMPIDQPPLVPLEAITPPPGTLPAPPPQDVLGAPPQTAPLPGPAANPYATPTVIFDVSAAPLPGGRIAVDPGLPAPTTPAGTHPKTTVTQGTLIPAVLETAIDTDVPGYVRAVVIRRRALLRWQPRAGPALLAPDRPVQERAAGGAEARLCDLDAPDPS